MTGEIALGSGRKARLFVLKDVVFCYCFELSKRCGYRLDEDLSVIVEWVMRVCEIKKKAGRETSSYHPAKNIMHILIITTSAIIPEFCFF
jgi:hypothetical protein